MKRNQVNDLFDKDTKRIKGIIIRTVMVSIIFVLSLLFLFIYINKRKVEYVKYNENSIVNYKVYLKDNEFYKVNIVEEDNQYVSELIDYINANFKHNITLEKNNLSYSYSYKIIATAIVKDKNTGKNIYQYKEELVSEKNVSANRANSVINENVNIDFNKYNEHISKFIQTYTLFETENTLKVELLVDMVGSCDENNNNRSTESITTLEIPLTHKTVSIDVMSNIVDEEENVMLCIKPSKLNIINLMVSIMFFIGAIIFTIKLILYIVHTRSAKSIYDKELKRIVSNYRSYIQKVNSRFSFSDYQTLKVDNFTDMLEIRDTTNQPILMIENGGKDSVYFVIPSATKILYIYSIKVSEIEKEMSEKNND